MGKVILLDIVLFLIFVGAVSAIIMSIISIFGRGRKENARDTSTK